MRKSLLITLLLFPGLLLAASVGSPEIDGEPIQVVLPKEFQTRNVGGSDGAGLCVYASARHTGLYQHNKAFEELFQWMRQYPGGSYPPKFDATLRKFCKEKGYEIPSYVHIEANDLDTLRLALKTGHYPCTTYSYSPTGRYGGRRINHMVNLNHLDDKTAVIFDNNYIGENSYESMDVATYLRVASGGGKLWAIILLDLPNAPKPRN